MRSILVLALAVLGAWLVLRRRDGADRRVVVVWDDGSELALLPGSSERELLVAVARKALA